MKLIDFYRNETPSHGGYYLNEILPWTEEKWEASHTEVQWVFPSRQRSMFNPDAPLLDDDAITLFQDDPELRENLVAAFDSFIGAYGITRDGSNFEWTETKRTWITYFNHNFLRLTRIMDCLYSVGMEDEAQGFCRFLIEEAGSTLSGNTRAFWENAANGRKTHE